MRMELRSTFCIETEKGFSHDDEEGLRTLFEQSNCVLNRTIKDILFFCLSEIIMEIPDN